MENLGQIEVWRPREPSWALSNVGCAYSPEGEELKCMFWEAGFRETPKLKTGRGIQGKDLQGNSGESFRMGTGDTWPQFKVFRASLEPRGIPWDTGMWTAEDMALTMGREVALRGRNRLGLHTTRIHFTIILLSFSPSWNLLNPPWYYGVYCLCF